MKANGALKRITAMLLTAMLALSAAAGAFAAPAFAEDEVPAAQPETAQPAAQPAAGISFDEGAFRTLTDRKVTGSSLGIELRGMANEGFGGYSVVQGGCTDGKYAYYLMVKKSNDMGKVLKVNLSDSRECYKSPVRINISHGNGMAYDSKNHRLVVSGRDKRRTQLTFIDADTLRFQGYKEVDYSTALAKKWKVNYGGKRAGLVALSYIERYDCYVAVQRKSYDLLVLDSLKNSVTVFTPTEYGRTIYEASEKYLEGEYDESAELWQDVLKMNANYPLAFRGIGRAILRQDEYKEAMDYFELAHDRENYGRAFKLYRKAWIEKNVLWIVIIIAALLLIPLIRGRIKKLKWEVSEYERGKIRK